jgi:hypothetical protein
MGLRAYNPLPYSPVLRRFDQDGDGDFDLEDVKILLGKKTLCGATTRSGQPCQSAGHEKYNNRCHQHKSDDKSN